MGRILLVTCLLGLIMNSQMSAQSFWKLDLPLGLFPAMKSDTSAAGLLAWMQEEPDSYLPVLFLAYYHGETEKGLLLSKCRAYHVDTLSSSFSWSAYFIYQYVRGYLGDPGALAAMDTVIRYSNREFDKFEAVRCLAENGKLDYFDFLQDVMKQPKFRYMLMDALVLYGKDPTFSSRVKSILQGLIEDPDETEAERSVAASRLADIDKPFAADLLNNLFRSTSGELRHDYFQDLSRLDPDGAAARAEYAIPREPDEFLRSEYVPVYIDSVYSRSFLQPSFLKFIQDWIRTKPRTSSVHLAGTILLDRFVPLGPSFSTPVSTILDSLVSYKHQIASYAWLADENFVNELDNGLENARKHLAKGDSVNAYKEVQKFQEKIQKEYDKTQENEKKNKPRDKRFVTAEGYKFLYYNAQYILDRLPAEKTKKK